MAYTADQRKKAREASVFKRQSPPTISLAIGVPPTTIRRWKSDALRKGDDWGVARSANLIAGQGLEAVVMTVVEDFVMLTHASMDDIKGSTSDVDTKVKQLASLADSMTKAVAAAARVTPKISELGVAQDVLQRMSSFVAENYPQHADAFLEILEPFGHEIVGAYS